MLLDLWQKFLKNLVEMFLVSQEFRKSRDKKACDNSYPQFKNIVCILQVQKYQKKNYFLHKQIGIIKTMLESLQAFSNKQN